MLSVLLISASPTSAQAADAGYGWSAFLNNQAEGAVTYTATPTGQVKTAWTHDFVGSGMWVYLDDPIAVDGHIYIASVDTLYAIDPQTGETTGSCSLGSSIGFGSRLSSADGVVIVPLDDGAIAGVEIDSMNMIWKLDALGESQQSLGTPRIADGRVYYGTTNGSSSYGILRCIDIRSGDVIWTYENNGSAYYWCGGIIAHDAFIIADNAGAIRAHNLSTGEVLQTLELGAAVFSTTVGTADELFIVTRDNGALHKISVSADCALAETGSTQFAARSASTPALFEGKLAVGGNTESYGGLVAIINADTLNVEHSITTLSDGTAIPAEVKSSPLVSVQDGGVYAYFCCNKQPGGMYRYHVGDADAEALYLPEGEFANYCDASVICDTSGSLYYRNDSGHLFKLVSGSSSGGGDDSGGGSDGGGDSGGESGANSSSGGKSSGVAGGTTRTYSTTRSSTSSSTRSSSSSTRSSGSSSSSKSNMSLMTDEASAESADAASDAPQSTPWLAWAGIAVGVAGLATLAVLFIRNRRKALQGQASGSQADAPEGDAPDAGPDAHDADSGTPTQEPNAPAAKPDAPTQNTGTEARPKTSRKRTRSST